MPKFGNGGIGSREIVKARQDSLSETHRATGAVCATVRHSGAPLVTERADPGNILTGLRGDLPRVDVVMCVVPLTEEFGLNFSE